jgi:glycosyltransferase involved in cell wall biosynthesis
MKTKLYFKGPLLTRSGYGEQSRFALRAIRSRSDLFDVYIQPLQWGQTSWVSENDEERRWIDQNVEKTIGYIQQGGTFDASFQVTIPNEWEKLAPVNIGFTAGMETTKVAHPWIEKGNEMDRIVVVSNHSKNTYKNTEYAMVNNQTGEQLTSMLQTEIDVANYPTKDFGEYEALDLELDYDFNFLCMAQFGPRKNMPNTVKWFVEEFHDEEIGLVVKSNIAKNCLMDREKLFHDLKGFVSNFPDRKCKVYLLHGDLDDKEIHSLFENPKIKAFLTLTHGEGFGLPVFEAAYTGIPVISPGWSGQLDFLVNKSTGKSEFYNVEYDLHPIPDHVVWEGVIIKESMWANPREHSAKQKMRECFSDLTGAENTEILEKFKKHANYLHETFSEEKQNAVMVNSICRALGVHPDKKTTDDIVLEFD